MSIELRSRGAGERWALRCESARKSSAWAYRSAAVLVVASLFVELVQTPDLLLILAVLGGLGLAGDLWRAALPFPSRHLRRAALRR